MIRSIPVASKETSNGLDQRVLDEEQRIKKRCTRRRVAVEALVTDREVFSALEGHRETNALSLGKTVILPQVSVGFHA